MDPTAPPSASPPKTIWWWVAAGGLVVAGAGALYLCTARGKKARKKIAKKWKQVRGGLAVAAISAAVNKASSRATERVIG